MSSGGFEPVMVVSALRSLPSYPSATARSDLPAAPRYPSGSSDPAAATAQRSGSGSARASQLAGAGASSSASGDASGRSGRLAGGGPAAPTSEAVSAAIAGKQGLGGGSGGDVAGWVSKPAAAPEGGGGQLSSLGRTQGLAMGAALKV
eukprot:353928-Chlamydomonas_euryale.AAC.1